MDETRLRNHIDALSIESLESVSKYAWELAQYRRANPQPITRRRPSLSAAQELVNCGQCDACKASRKHKPHGPYWYAHWRDVATKKRQTLYVGTVWLDPVWDAASGRYVRLDGKK